MKIKTDFREDFTTFFLIMLMMLLVVMLFIPLKFLSLFFGDKITRCFVKLFKIFE